MIQHPSLHGQRRSGARIHFDNGNFWRAHHRPQTFSGVFNSSTVNSDNTSPSGAGERRLLLGVVQGPAGIRQSDLA